MSAINGRCVSLPFAALNLLGSNTSLNITLRDRPYAIFTTAVATNGALAAINNQASLVTQLTPILLLIKTGA